MPCDNRSLTIEHEPMTEEKKIAIFIPCYNAAATIAATITSVSEAIDAIGWPVSVYLYDDCSKDESVTVAQKSWQRPGGLIVHRNAANSGERRTTNEAFAGFLGRYDWVFIIHADDIVKKDWLTTLYQQIVQVDDRRCFTVWSSFDSLDSATDKLIPGDNTGHIHVRERTPEEQRQYITRLYCSWHISGAAINVNLYQALQGFDVTMPQFGDTDFFARGLLAGFNDVYISRTLTFYRVVVGSVSSTSVRTNRDIREILYIIDKFGDILKQDEMKQLQKRLAVLSFRRSCRWAIHLHPRNFLFCLGVACRSLIQSTFPSKKNLQYAGK